MTLSELSAVVWRRRAIVVAIAAVIFVVGLLAVLAGRSTNYTAHSQVLVDQPDLVGDPAGASVPAKFGALMPTFCRFVLGDDEVTRIGAAANLPPGTVRGSLACDPASGTTVMILTGRAGNAATARTVSVTAAKVSAADLTSRYSGSAVPERDRIVASVITSAGRPHADPHHTLRQLGLVLVAGLVVGIAFVVAAEPMRRRTDDDIAAARERELAGV